MNLVQVQEHLKGMPTQIIMGYANGQNPQVPPYIALGELNRRKQMEQQPAQAPQGSVKEQIEQSLMQPQQLPGLAAQGVPVPQPPQPQGMPAQMPKQLAGPAPQQAPTQMAAGGLASVPIREDMFRYAPGGIVAFDGGGLTNEQMARQVLGEQLRGETAMEEPEDPEVMRERMAEKYPILKTLPGAQAEALATKLEAQDAAQKAKFQESEGVRGLAALSNALIQAGEATRGQKGFGNQLGSAFGGFGKAYNAETAAKEERAAKQEGLERGRMVDVSKIRSDVEGLQRAQAEGRVGEAMKYKEALNRQIAEVEKTQGSAAAAVLKNQIDQAQLASTRDYHKAMIDAKPSAEDKLLTTVMARVNADPAIRGLADAIKTGTVAPGSEEYNTLIANISKLSAPYYKAAGLDAPPAAELAQEAIVPSKKGFWASLFGGESKAAPAPNVVDFSKLPK